MNGFKTYLAAAALLLTALADWFGAEIPPEFFAVEGGLIAAFLRHAVQKAQEAAT